MAFNVKFYRVSHKLQAPLRSTTTAVNLHICVATIAAHRYERGAKKIDQDPPVTLNSKDKKDYTPILAFNVISS